MPFLVYRGNFTYEIFTSWFTLLDLLVVFYVTVLVMSHFYQRTISYKVFYTFLFHIKSRGGVKIHSLSMFSSLKYVMVCYSSVKLVYDTSLMIHLQSTAECKIWKSNVSNEVNSMRFSLPYIFHSSLSFKHNLDAINTNTYIYKL